MKFPNRKGQTLAAMAITTALMAAGVTAWLNFTSQQLRSSSGIAGKGRASDLSNSLSTLFGSPNCYNSGAYLLSGAPASVAVSTGYTLNLDTINFPSGANALTSVSPAMGDFLAPYWVASIAFTSNGGNTATVYPFQMTISFGAPAGSLQPKPVIKTVLVYTNAAKAVQGICTGASTAPGTGISNVASLEVSLYPAGSITLDLTTIDGNGAPRILKCMSFNGTTPVWGNGPYTNNNPTPPYGCAYNNPTAVFPGIPPGSFQKVGNFTSSGGPILALGSYIYASTQLTTSATGHLGMFYAWTGSFTSPTYWTSAPVSGTPPNPGQLTIFVNQDNNIVGGASGSTVRVSVKLLQ